MSKINVSKEWLKRKYFEEGLSCEQIAGLLGNCSRQAVFKRLRLFGIPTRSKREKIFFVDGQRCKISQGYFWIWAPYHPRQNGGYVKRAVLNLEKKLGRSLADSEIVHHNDGNRLNDAPGNLEVTNTSEHMRIHRANGDIYPHCLPTKKADNDKS